MGGTVFITGGSGLLALNWAIALRDRHRIVLGLHSRMVAPAGVGVYRVRLDSLDDLHRVYDEIEADLVVHTAGLTNVEACEADPQRAHHVNVDLAATVAVACAARHLPLVHISTDHLFRGDDEMVGETHRIDPQNVYGRTKAEAEVRVLEAHPGALVVRTNFYGWGPSYRRGFSDKVLDALRNDDPITLFEDVFFTPILCETLSHAVHELVHRNATGIVNVVGDQRISKYEFGLKIAREFGLDDRRVTAGRMDDHAALVKRPHDMSLSNERVRRVLGRTIGDVDAHLRRLHQQEKNGVARELLNL